MGLDAWLGETGRSHQLVGVAGSRHMEFGLADLLSARVDEDDYGPAPGNVAWTNLASGPGGQLRPAVRCGLYLVHDRDTPSAILIMRGDPDSDMAADVRTLALRHNVFRGQVISFGREMFGDHATVLQFHTRPAMTADNVILPEQTLAMIRRQVIGVAEHREHCWRLVNT